MGLDPPAGVCCSKAGQQLQVTAPTAGGWASCPCLIRAGDITIPAHTHSTPPLQSAGCCRSQGCSVPGRPCHRVAQETPSCVLCLSRSSAGSPESCCSQRSLTLKGIWGSHWPSPSAIAATPCKSSECGLCAFVQGVERLAAVRTCAAHSVTCIRWCAAIGGSIPARHTHSGTHARPVQQVRCAPEARSTAGGCPAGGG
jgi:hypothetical protein